MYSKNKGRKELLVYLIKVIYIYTVHPNDDSPNLKGSKLSYFMSHYSSESVVNQLNNIMMMRYKYCWGRLKRFQ